MLRHTGVFDTAPGTPYYNSLYFIGSTAGEAVAAAEAAHDFWSHLGNALRTDMVWRSGTEVDLVDVATGQVTETFAVPSNTVEFSGTLEPLPPANQALIRLRTNAFENGRRIRGRIFVPGVTEAFTQTGVVQPGSLTLLQDAANLLITSGGAAGGLCVYSVTHRMFAQVSSASPWDQFAVQRSRRP